MHRTRNGFTVQKLPCLKPKFSKLQCKSQPLIKVVKKLLVSLIFVDTEIKKNNLCSKKNKSKNSLCLSYVSYVASSLSLRKIIVRQTGHTKQSIFLPVTLLSIYRF